MWSMVYLRHVMWNMVYLRHVMWSMVSLWASRAMEVGFYQWRESVVGMLALREVHDVSEELQNVQRALDVNSAKLLRHRSLSTAFGVWALCLSDTKKALLSALCEELQQATCHACHMTSLFAHISSLHGCLAG